jgi:hypothetical protein
MPDSSGGPWLDLIFVVVAVVLAVAGGLYAYRVSKRQNKSHLKSLRERGYVMQYAHEKNRGTVTRIWAPFSQAIPLYVQFSNRDLVQVLVGRLGIKDMKTGNGEFDRAFVVRGNMPEQVRALLTPDVQTRLLKSGDIAFLTGSNESLLCAEFPNETKEESKLRQFWMVVTQGKLSEEEAKPFLEFGRELASKVELLCKHLPVSTVADIKTQTFEGR